LSLAGGDEEVEEQEQVGLNVLINRHKSVILNVAIVLGAIYFASKIYVVQAKKTLNLSQEKEIALKKNEALAELGGLENRLTAYKSFLQKDITLAINTLAEIAKDSSVRIAAVAPGKEEYFNTYIKYPFDLTLEADNYNLLGTFISRLESHHDIYIIDVMSIKPQLLEAQGKKTKLNVALKLSTVLFK
jgi:hypothetical protein